jgi:hypothetical protein
MQAVVFDWKNHGPVVADWWRAWGWPVMGEEHFPFNGRMILKDGVPVAAGWLFLTDSAWAILEWIVGNPNAAHGERVDAIDLLVEELLRLAKDNGKLEVFSSVNHPTLIDAYRRHGMMETDKGMTNFVWRAQ